MNRNEFLADVDRVLEKRSIEYGDARELFEEIARRWSLILDTHIPITPESVALCMIEFKMARLVFNPNHADSIRDIAGYAALLAEIQA
jgi:hypothetical protein